MLSQRLQSLARFHENQDTIWDIGCDHGALGLSFLKHSHVSQIHLVDPSHHVIKSLKTKLEDSYITIPDNVLLHETKGQDIKLKSSRNLIFISGMGGKEITEIIHSLLPQLSANDRLVISPHKNILELRQSLSLLPLSLKDEILVLDEGRFYQVLCLLKGEGLPVTEFGQAIWSHSEGASYRDFMLKTFSAHQDPLSRRFVTFLQSLSL